MKLLKLADFRSKTAMTAKKKLLKLADFLEHKVKSSWFDMDAWGTPGFTRKECGSVACAAGWATVCFPRSGLTLLPCDVLHNDGLFVDFRHDVELVIAYKRDHKRTLRGFATCRAFFEIDAETAGHLFDSSEYPARRQGRMSVVRRLRTVANKL